MDFHTAAIIGFTAFKLTSLTVGLAAVFMGYNLFKHGVWGHPSELVAAVGKGSILLKSAAPGIFFALFGTAVVITTLVKGFNVQFPEAESQTMTIDAKLTPPPLSQL